MTVKVLVLTGSMGAGKTTLMAEASDLLAAAGIAHAAIDVDALGIYHLPSAAHVVADNLAALWRNLTAAGATRFLVAEALETAADRERLARTFGGAELTVCRVVARVETMQRRVRQREPGMLQQKFVDRVVALERVQSDARVEDFCVTNEGRSITEVAREVLVRVGWLEADAGGRPR